MGGGGKKKELRRLNYICIHKFIYISLALYVFVRLLLIYPFSGILGFKPADLFQCIGFIVLI